MIWQTNLYFITIIITFVLMGFLALYAWRQQRVRFYRERYEAVEALRTEYANAQRYLDVAGVILLALNTQGEIILLNRKGYQLLGYPEGELTGKRWIDTCLPEKDRPYIRNVINQLMAGELNSNEDVKNLILTRDGTERLIAWKNTILRDQDGNITGTLSSGEDITQRKQAEEQLKSYSERLEEMVKERTRALEEAQEQLIRQERLAMLGQLAGGVSHELRNPLGIISNAIYYLQHALPEPDDKIKEYLGMIESETRAASKIITDLLSFARVQYSAREPVMVSELVSQTLKRFPTPENIAVSITISPDLPPVYIDPSQIEQVLGNLVVNACQAMPEGGQLTIRGEFVIRDQMVAIHITDTGAGILPEYLSMLFEPLFSTKIKGIGLGLAISRKLVDLNDSRIEVQNEPDKGCTFTVYLPVAKA